MRNNGNVDNIKKLNEVYEGIGNIEVPQKFENNNIYQTSFNNNEVEGEHCTCDYCSCSHGFGLQVNKWKGGGY